MYGPERKGHWSDTLEARPFEMLMPGRRYVVVRVFRDYDGDTHPVGESWRYVAYNYLPYDAGLSLFVSLDGEHEWHLRLRHHPEEQGTIVDRLADYVVPLPEDATARAAVPDLGRDRMAFVMPLAGGAMAVALSVSLASGASLAGGLLAGMSAGAAALVLSIAAWPARRESVLRRRILSPMRAHDVEVLLGTPAQKIDTFPGEIVEVWTYPAAALLAGRHIGIPLAIDFGSDDRVRGVRRLRSNP